MLFVLLAASASIAARAEVSLIDPRWNGLELRFAAKLEPSGTLTGTSIHGLVATGPRRPYRLIFDRSQKRYFGYDLTVDALPGGQALRITLGPLTPSPEQLAEAGVDDSWTSMSLPKYPRLPLVRPGETIAIDLLVNSASGSRIADYISVAAAAGPPRDFSVQDALLELEQTRLAVDGSLVDASTRVGNIAGAVIWFYLPGRGRYILSLVPNAPLGFSKSGEVSLDHLIFSDGRSSIRIDCTRRIAPGEGRYNLYVLHDPAWRPNRQDAGQPFLLGAADHAELLIRR